MTYKEIEAKLKELKELKVLAEELKDQIETLEDQVKAEMTEQSSRLPALFALKYRAMAAPTCPAPAIASAGYKVT